MLRLLTFFLVFVLSGVPAAAVVCDLLVCAKPSEAPQQRCHQHVASQAGERVAPGAAECDHVITAGPFLTSSPRFVTHDEVSTGSVHAVGAFVLPARAVLAAHGHGPPHSPRATLPLPLRI